MANKNILTDFAVPKSHNKACTTALALIISLSPILSPEIASAQTVLQTVTVKEKAEKENSGYQGGKTNIGKTTQSAKDVPQSLTIVNRNLMDDRNVDTLKDALRNIAGLTFNAGEGGRIGDNITIRGFGASSDLYLDGMRDNAQYNRETFNLEQVEALRGSASMLFGRGSTGGVINQVSKEPELGKISNVAVTAGSHDYFRETMDVNQETGDSSAFRINLMKTDSNSNRDAVQKNSFGIAPSFKWGIDTANEFLLSYSHLQYDDVPDYGIPLRGVAGAKPVNVSDSNFYGLAGDYQKDSANVYTGRWIHKFNEDNQLKTVLRHNSVERDLRAVAPRFDTVNPLTTDIVRRQRQARGAEEKTTALQTDYTSKFAVFNMKHEALLGGEYLYETANRWSSFSTTANPNTNLNNPNPYDSFNANFEKINPIDFKDTNLGIYAQDLIEFVPHWKLLFGGRYDDFKANYKSTTTTTGAVSKYERKDKVFSYRTGLMFQPSDHSTYYVSYGTSFNPSGDLYSVEATNASRSAKTDPEKSINTEIGAKWELFEGDLSLRTAIFRSEKTNERNTDPASATTDAYLLSGRRHTDGIELEANGKLTKNWEIFSGIAFMKARIDKSINQNLVGLTPSNTPTISGNLWSTYKITPNWKIGGGVDFVGERTGYSTTGTTMPIIRKVPGYARYDAMVEWKLKQYSVKLNIFNLLDKEYFDSIYQTSGAHAVPGIDRSGQVTVSYKF